MHVHRACGIALPLSSHSQDAVSQSVVGIGRNLPGAPEVDLETWIAADGHVLIGTHDPGNMCICQSEGFSCSLFRSQIRTGPETSMSGLSVSS